MNWGVCMDYSNRRQYLRIPDDSDVTITTEDQVYHMDCQDFSVGGLAVSYIADLSLGQIVDVSINMIIGQLVSKAIVKWIKDDLAVGLEFITPDIPEEE
jgi:hypothetical protein